jgi:hypothetical protein
VLGFKVQYDGPISIQVEVETTYQRSTTHVLCVSSVASRGPIVVFLAIMATVVRLVWKGLGKS